MIFDGNFYHKSPIWHLRRSQPAPFYIFTLKAPLEICIERDKGRERVYGEDATTWVYYLVSRFESGAPIDITGKTGSEVVHEILTSFTLS